MSDVLPYNEKDMGELKFEFTTEHNSDDDLKFVSSVKNLLVLIKDFYGADSSAVFWFNKIKNSFKLLASSEDEQWNNYQDRYSFGEDNYTKDILSKACAKRSFEIYNDITKLDNDSLSCFKNAAKVKSVIINPLEINGDVLALILCESKSENFFGNPNLYTLEVFSESIINFIKYFTLKEEYEHKEKTLQAILKDKENEINFIDKVYNLYDKSYFQLRLDCEISRCRVLNSNELILVYSSVDNITDLKDNEIELCELIKLYAGEIKNEFQGYDMIFYLGENILGIILQTQNSDKVFIELEKIRKLISTKIYNINGKEISFTVSFGGKRYDDVNMDKEQYLTDVLSILESAKKEGGNTVKL